MQCLDVGQLVEGSISTHILRQSKDLPSKFFHFLNFVRTSHDVFVHFSCFLSFHGLKTFSKGAGDILKSSPSNFFTEASNCPSPLHPKVVFNNSSA